MRTTQPRSSTATGDNWQRTVMLTTRLTQPCCERQNSGTVHGIWQLLPWRVSDVAAAECRWHTPCREDLVDLSAGCELQRRHEDCGDSVNKWHPSHWQVTADDPLGHRTIAKHKAITSALVRKQIFTLPGKYAVISRTGNVRRIIFFLAHSCGVCYQNAQACDSP